MATQELTKTTFESTVDADGIVLVDFWADWCGPCKRFAPTFEKASEAHPDVVFGKVDTEAEQELAGAAGIRSIPTLMAFRDGILVFSQPGALPPSALEQVIEGVKGLDMDDVRAQVARHRAAQHRAPSSRTPDHGTVSVVGRLISGRTAYSVEEFGHITAGLDASADRRPARLGPGSPRPRSGRVLLSRLRTRQPTIRPVPQPPRPGQLAATLRSSPGPAARAMPRAQCAGPPTDGDLIVTGHEMVRVDDGFHASGGQRRVRRGDVGQHLGPLFRVCGLHGRAGQLLLQFDDPAVDRWVADLHPLPADQLTDHRRTQPDHGRQLCLGNPVRPEQPTESVRPPFAVDLDLLRIDRLLMRRTDRPDRPRRPPSGFCVRPAGTWRHLRTGHLHVQTSASALHLQIIAKGSL